MRNRININDVMDSIERKMEEIIDLNVLSSEDKIKAMKTYMGTMKAAVTNGNTYVYREVQIKSKTHV